MFDFDVKFKYFYKILLQAMIFVLVLPVTAYILYNKINSPVLIGRLFAYSFFMWSATYGFSLFRLYFNHKNKSKDVVFKKLNGDFLYTNSIEEIKFTKIDVKGIEVYVTPAVYNKDIDYLFIGAYHYCKFILHNNKVITVSCLLYDTVFEDFDKDIILMKRKFFPLVQNNEIEINKNWNKENASYQEALDSGNREKNFKEKFNQKTTDELKNIVSNPKSYQPKAVEAAKELIQERTKTL